MSSRTSQVTVPSSTSSSTPVTVTVWFVLQVPEAPAVKASDGGDTLPSLASRLVTDTVTACDAWVASAGSVTSRTVKVAVPPASVAEPLTVPTSRPSSSSALTAWMVTAESAS